MFFFQEEMKKVSGFLFNDNGRSPLFGMRFGDTSRYEIHLIHSSIPAADQKKVFEPSPIGVRRIILGTNICEASITLPRVTVVIDTSSVKRKVSHSSRKRADPTF
jgi:HrpA-like RNA helicase